MVASLASVHAHVLTSHLLQHGKELLFLRCVIKPRSSLNAEGDPRRCLNTTGLDHQLIDVVEVSPIFGEPADGFLEGIHAIHLWVSKDRTDLVSRCHLTSPSPAQAKGPGICRSQCPSVHPRCSDHQPESRCRLRSLSSCHRCLHHLPEP